MGRKRRYNLTEAQIQEILAHPYERGDVGVLANKHGCSKAVIYNVIHGIGCYARAESPVLREPLHRAKVRRLRVRRGVFEIVNGMPVYHECLTHLDSDPNGPAEFVMNAGTWKCVRVSAV